MASFAVLVFLLFAGIDYGTQPGAEFNKVEMALENAVAGSGGDLKYVYETIRVCGDGGCDYFDVCRSGPGFC